MIKKELAVYHRVPGSSDQNTDLDITLGEGMKYRTRTCNGPAKVCVGEKQQVHECNLPACTTTSTTMTPKITTTVVSTTTLPALGIIPDGHPDYDILMHKPGHCSGTWTEWSDHTDLTILVFIVPRH